MTLGAKDDQIENCNSFAGRMGQQSGRGFRDALTLCRRRVSFAIQLGVARQLVPLFRLMREDGDESLFLNV